MDGFIISIKLEYICLRIARLCTKKVTPYICVFNIIVASKSVVNNYSNLLIHNITIHVFKNSEH